MRSALRAACASAMTAAMVVALSIPSAHADPSTGTLTGRITESGTPVSAFLTLVDTNDGFVASTGTDGDGRYTFADLTPGQYKVQYFASVGLFLWMHQKTSSAEADLFTVTAGGTTVADEELPPTGSIAGTYADHGIGVPDVDVSASPLDSNPSFGFGRTDASGHFELDHLLPGRYRVTFSLRSGGQQYYQGQLDPNEATAVVVTGGGRTEIAENRLPVGSLSGRLVENGVPVEGAFVGAAYVNEFTSAFTSTDADGRYALPQVFAGTYRVSFQLPDGRRQFAHGKLDDRDADLIQVAEGAETVVDETVLPTGAVDVRAVDRRTGAALTNFCAEIRGVFACTETDVAHFDKVPIGTHQVPIFIDSDAYVFGASGQVTVTAGATSSVTVPVTPAAIVTTTVLDRATGAPVPNVCLDAVTLQLARLPDGSGNCSDEAGNVRVGRLAAGSYTLFASVDDGAHGVQWVGATGGTGNQLQARILQLAEGQHVTLPPVRMDRAGSVTGRITDKATGAPLAFAGVSLLTSHPGVGATGPNAATDADGRYTLGNLGPYQWPLHFRAFGYAAQWSGGSPTRLLATPVRVVAGGTVTADARLGIGTLVQGTVTDGGQPVREFSFVTAYEAVTGDLVGVGVTSETGGYEMPLLGPTAVRILIEDGRELRRWHRDAADFAHATTVLVPSSGTRTVNIAFS